jgi:hypothetical protein
MAPCGPPRGPLRIPGQLLAPLLATLLLAACAVDPYRDDVTLAAAVQRPHPAAVPHTDRSGAMLQQFDARQSFFPLGLSGALVDFGHSSRGFHTVFQADFNAVVADAGQPLEDMLVAAEASRLQLLRPQRDLLHTALLDASAAVLVEMPRDPAAIDRFAATAGDHRGRPVWALLPAHGNAGTPLPDPAVAQLLAFAAIVGGATGLVWQGEDNYIARNAGMIGISPQPQLDYGIRTGETAPLAATPDATVAARRLWEAVTQINRRVSRITPALLQPDAAVPYRILAPASDGAAPPRLRSLLKAHDDGLLLIVVNAEPVPVDFSVALPFASVARLGDVAPVEQEEERQRFRDRIPGHGVQIYRIAGARRLS